MRRTKKVFASPRFLAPPEIAAASPSAAAAGSISLLEALPAGAFLGAMSRFLVTLLALTTCCSKRRRWWGPASSLATAKLHHCRSSSSVGDDDGGGQPAYLTPPLILQRQQPDARPLVTTYSTQRQQGGVVMEDNAADAFSASSLAAAGGDLAAALESAPAAASGAMDTFQPLVAAAELSRTDTFLAAATVNSVDFSNDNNIQASEAAATTRVTRRTTAAAAHTGDNLSLLHNNVVKSDLLLVCGKDGAIHLITADGDHLWTANLNDSVDASLTQPPGAHLGSNHRKNLLSTTEAGGEAVVVVPPNVAVEYVEQRRAAAARGITGRPTAADAATTAEEDVPPLILGPDGNLFYRLNDTALAPLKIHVQDIVENAPFTVDLFPGIVFVGTRESSVQSFDLTTGLPVNDASLTTFEGEQHCGGGDDVCCSSSRQRSGSHPQHQTPRHRRKQIRLGQITWSVSARDHLTNKERWRIQFKEVAPITNLGGGGSETADDSALDDAHMFCEDEQSTDYGGYEPFDHSDEEEEDEDDESGYYDEEHAQLQPRTADRGEGLASHGATAAPASGRPTELTMATTKTQDYITHSAGSAVPSETLAKTSSGLSAMRERKFVDQQQHSPRDNPAPLTWVATGSGQMHKNISSQQELVGCSNGGDLFVFMDKNTLHFGTEIAMTKTLAATYTQWQQRRTSLAEGPSAFNLLSGSTGSTLVRVTDPALASEVVIVNTDTSHHFRFESEIAAVLRLPPGSRDQFVVVPQVLIAAPERKSIRFQGRNGLGVGRVLLKRLLLEQDFVRGVSATSTGVVSAGAVRRGASLLPSTAKQNELVQAEPDSSTRHSHAVTFGRTKGMKRRYNAADHLAVIAGVSGVGSSDVFDSPEEHGLRMMTAVNGGYDDALEGFPEICESPTYLSPLLDSAQYESSILLIDDDGYTLEWTNDAARLSGRSAATSPIAGTGHEVNQTTSVSRRQQDRNKQSLWERLGRRLFFNFGWWSSGVAMFFATIYCNFLFWYWRRVLFAPNNDGDGCDSLFEATVSSSSSLASPSRMRRSLARISAKRRRLLARIASSLKSPFRSKSGSACGDCGSPFSADRSEYRTLRTMSSSLADGPPIRSESDSTTAEEAVSKLSVSQPGSSAAATVAPSSTMVTSTSFTLGDGGSSSGSQLQSQQQVRGQQQQQPELCHDQPSIPSASPAEICQNVQLLQFLERRVAGKRIRRMTRSDSDPALLYTTPQQFPGEDDERPANTQRDIWLFRQQRGRGGRRQRGLKAGRIRAISDWDEYAGMKAVSDDGTVDCCLQETYCQTTTTRVCGRLVRQEQLTTTNNFSLKYKAVPGASNNGAKQSTTGDRCPTYSSSPIPLPYLTLPQADTHGETTPWLDLAVSPVESPVRSVMDGLTTVAPLPPIRTPLAAVIDIPGPSVIKSMSSTAVAAVQASTTVATTYAVFLDGPSPTTPAAGCAEAPVGLECTAARNKQNDETAAGDLVVARRNSNFSPSSQGVPPGSKLASCLENGRLTRTFEGLQMIGNGGFGCVFRVRHKFEPGNPAYALKVIPLSLRATENVADRRYFREVSANRDLFSKQVVRYFTWWVEEAQYVPAPSAAKAFDGRRVSVVKEEQDNNRNKGHADKNRPIIDRPSDTSSSSSTSSDTGSSSSPAAAAGAISQRQRVRRSNRVRRERRPPRPRKVCRRNRLISGRLDQLDVNWVPFSDDDDDDVVRAAAEGSGGHVQQQTDGANIYLVNRFGTCENFSDATTSDHNALISLDPEELSIIFAADSFSAAGGLVTTTPVAPPLRTQSRISSARRKSEHSVLSASSSVRIATANSYRRICESQSALRSRKPGLLQVRRVRPPIFHCEDSHATLFASHTCCGRSVLDVSKFRAARLCSKRGRRTSGRQTCCGNSGKAAQQQDHATTGGDSSACAASSSSGLTTTTTKLAVNVGPTNAAVRDTAADPEPRFPVVLVIQMELMPGLTLRQWLSHSNRPTDPSEFIARMQSYLSGQSKKPPEEVLMFKQLMRGLKDIHGHGIVHRDIKPENIFLSFHPLTLKIGDFGLARFQENTRHTASVFDPRIVSWLPRVPSASSVAKFGKTDSVVSVKGLIIGTPGYTAPEGGALCTEKADVFSAALVLIELFSPRFCTVMERSRTLDQFRHYRKLPAHIDTYLSEWATLIQAMGASKPEDRPSADQVYRGVRQRRISFKKRGCENEFFFGKDSADKLLDGDPNSCDSL